MNLPKVQQEKGNWCWAASTQAIMKYHGVTPSYSQCNLVNVALGTSNCPDQAGSFYGDIDDLYNHFGRSPGTKVAYIVNFATMKSRVDAGRPLQIRYGYKSSLLTTGHVVTVYGYSGSSTVYWLDTATGQFVSGSYDYLYANGTWTGTNSRYNQGV
nr:C39 family peptidase [Cellulomonas septica]